MTLTDYYKGQHLPGAAKTRYDITASTGSYDQFEHLLHNKRGGLSFYFSDIPEAFKFNRSDPPDKCISRGSNISSIFVPSPSLPFGFGDIKGTSDALLIIHSDDWQTIEIFIARGMKNHKRNLYFLLKDNELENEISLLREKSKPI